MIKNSNCFGVSQKEKLVKHSLEEIENCDLFKYSPYKRIERQPAESSRRYTCADTESGNVNVVVKWNAGKR